MGLHLLYGGTFDPLHAGHLAVARAALARTGAGRLDFLPAADPPHRAAPGAGFADRQAMIAAALAELGSSDAAVMGVDAREGRRAGPSYSVDTLREWRAEHGETAPLGFVLGADAFLGLPGWHAWQAMFDLAHLVVAPRPGCGLGELSAPLMAACEGRWANDPHALHATSAGRVFVLDLPLRQESATAVRRALAGAEAGDAALPAAVAALIKARGLYRGRRAD